MPDLRRRTRLALSIQRQVGRFSSFIWVPTIAFVLRVLLGYRIRNVGDVRHRFRKLVREHKGPLLICANHLTMADSALVAWALGGSWWYVLNYRRMPWNLPEYHNFAFNWINRAAAWIAKCIPVVRGGSREHVSSVLRRIQHLLSRGDTALIFAEGGRSRSGRVETDSAAYGVGRLLASVRNCSALCVYLRGDRQATWSTVPARGDSFYVDFEMIQPASEHSGLRRSRDLAQQIVVKLAVMEETYFARRQEQPATT